MRELSYLNRISLQQAAGGLSARPARSGLPCFSQDAPSRQIVGRQLEPDFFTRYPAGKAITRPAGRKGDQAMTIGQSHQACPIWQNFDHYAFDLEGTFSGHVNISGSASVISTVCSK